MSPLGKKIVLGISLLVVAYAATGYMLGRSPDDKAFRALTVYSEVLEHIQRDYVDDPNMHAVTNGSLHGLLDSLDPQSAGGKRPGAHAPLRLHRRDRRAA